jgi:penicillin-binding protein 1A
MVRAVANRPAEAFEIEVQTPEWAVTEPDEETWFEAPDNGVFVNPDGSGPAGSIPPSPPRDEDEGLPPDEHDRLDQDFIDRATDSVRPEPLPRRDRDAPRRERRSDRPAEPVEEGPMTSEP